MITYVTNCMNYTQHNIYSITLCTDRIYTIHTEYAMYTTYTPHTEYTLPTLYTIYIVYTLYTICALYRVNAWLKVCNNMNTVSIQYAMVTSIM